MYKKYNYDIKSYLNDKHIKYFLSGKNTLRKAISTRCLWHNDRSNHLNIFPDGGVKCWHCGWIKGGFRGYIQEVEKCNFYQSIDIAKQYADADYGYEDEEEQIIIRPKSVVMPKSFSSSFPKKYQDYLTNRGFDWRYLRDKYSLLSTKTPTSKWKFRIVAPVYEDGELVSYIGRDITDKQSLRYKVLDDDLAVVPRRELIYGIDNLTKDTCVVLEGISDVWRFGDNAIGLLSIAFSKEQILKLKRKGVKKFVIGFDVGAEEAVEKIECSLGFADEISYIELPSYADDVGELSQDDVSALRREIFS